MNLALKAVSGPRKDELFPLKDGLTVGRQGAGITLDDPKISSLHARIMAQGTQWFIADNNSKNGLRLDGEKAARIELKPGTSFFIGDSEFMVMELEAPKPKPKPLKQQRYWHTVLGEFIASQIPSVKDQHKPVSALEPALILEFVRGTQVETKWVLGFGPRKVGASSIDLPIWEPGAPPTCFEITPTNSGILFKTPRPDLVLLNGQAVDSQVLRMGDTIRILDTMIEVDFAE